MTVLTPPEQSQTAAEPLRWQRYPRRAMYARVVVALMGTFVLDVILVLLWLAASFFLPLSYGEIAFFTLASLQAMSICLIPSSVRLSGYAINAGSFHTMDGVLRKTTTFTPLNRIRHVSSSQGVVQRLLGLSSVQIYSGGSAGTEVELDSLSCEQVAQVMSQLRTICSQEVVIDGAG